MSDNVMAKQKKRAVHRATLRQVAALVILSGGMALAGMMQLFERGQTVSIPTLYGTWVEQDVAPYLADSFELRPSGVFVAGRQINTQYVWDGSKLEYRLGDELYSYLFLSGQLVRQQPAHYTSAFSRL
ncbi:DUF2850 domain-containing protein [Photobacterium japonica]|uniref:DUF2850 domain-containing protein n=1 Tax=Photobacterium japonica TaxID=2910235 RepID=UPI003D099BD4